MTKRRKERKRSNRAEDTTQPTYTITCEPGCRQSPRRSLEPGPGAADLPAKSARRSRAGYRLSSCVGTLGGAGNRRADRGSAADPGEPSADRPTGRARLARARRFARKVRPSGVVRLRAGARRRSRARRTTSTRGGLSAGAVLDDVRLAQSREGLLVVAQLAEHLGRVFSQRRPYPPRLARRLRELRHDAGNRQRCSVG